MSSYYTYEGNLRDRNKFTSTVNTTFGTKRYFSQLDTEVYFGAEQIDEIVAIDFTISEPKLPIYGFNSFYANRIVSGRRTIQGTFAINFTSTVYLLEVFNRIDDSILKAAYNPSGSNLLLDYESLLYRCEGEDTTGLGIGNNALFSKIFDITLSYGYGKTEGKQTYNSCYQTLVGVQIVDYRQALDTEGNPILDMYSFIAKDIRYIDSEYVIGGGSNSGGTGEEKEPDTPTCPYCKKSPCTCPEWKVANTKIPKELEELEAWCKDTENPGFKITPTFNYSPPGSVAGSAFPYLRLTIEGVNNNTDIYTDVIVTINNLAMMLDDIENGDARGDIHEFKEEARDLGVTLQQTFTKDKDTDSVSCTVEFNANIGGKYTKVSHSTTLKVGTISPV